MKTEFPYQKEESRLFGTIYRPIVEFEVKTNVGWIRIMAYLDSGADITLLPTSFLDLLDIEFKEEDIKEIGGVGGSKVPIVLENAELRICSKEINVKVAIALVKDTPYLLGREGVFKHFEICFRKNKTIHFVDGEE